MAGGSSVTDAELLQHITELVEEEHRLLKATERGEVFDHTERRLHELDAVIAQQWDLLRQRRALRRNGQDPGLAQLRDPDTIERYRQ